MNLTNTYRAILCCFFVIFICACQPLQIQDDFTLPENTRDLVGLAAYQQIEITHDKSYRRFDAALEITHEGVTMRLLSEIGQPLGTLTLTQHLAQLNRANRYVDLPPLAYILESIRTIFLAPPPVDTAHVGENGSSRNGIVRRALFHDGALARVIEYDTRCAWNGGARYEDSLNNYQVTVTSVLLNPTKTNTYHEFRCP